MRLVTGEMSKKTLGHGKPVKKNVRSGWLAEDVKTNTGLPPQVYGQVRCFLKLSVSQIVWTVPKPPDLALVRVKWWGEEGDGVLFRPLDVKKGNKAECHITARYPVRSGPCQFATYLNDMGSLTLDLLTGPSSEVIGQATVTQIGLLTNTRPINGFFSVVSTNGQKLANLQVSIVLEPLLVSYDNMGSIPTTDISMENGRSYDSMVLPVNNHPLPYSDLPTRPDNTVFVSPFSVNNNRQGDGQAGLNKIHLNGGIHRQLNYGLPTARANASHQSGSGAVAITTNGDVVSLPESRVVSSGGNLAVSNTASGTVSMNGSKSPTRRSGPAEKDLLSVLVEKGTKLREAMIVSSMHADVNTDSLNVGKGTDLDRPNNPGFTSFVNTQTAPPMNELIGSSRSALDFLLTSPVKNKDFHLYNLMNGLSPGTSVSSDMGYSHVMSDLEDPMHENSIIHELFYHNSDIDGLGFSDISGYDKSYKHHHLSPDNHFMSLPAWLPNGSGGENPLEAAGNQRPPSRTSSLTSLNVTEPAEDGGKKRTKRRTRSRSRSSSRSLSRTRSRSSPSGNLEVKSKIPSKIPEVLKDPRSVKPRKKVRSRSNSRSRSRSRLRRRNTSIDGASDSDRLSSVYSENTRDLNEPKHDGLSVERLTLLGRVHVARVHIDSLQLLKADLLDTSDSKLSVSKFKGGKPPRPQKSKKPCTYFVEYQFPVVAASRDKYTPNAMVTEVTRIASKNIKNGVVTFNHRSVFPILFDGVTVERWWKAALVFRLYCREAGQQVPALIGSGGISLKSVLRSENLFVQRDIEILDTSKNGVHSSSHASLNSSASGRSGASVLGNLKVSVELASDHKEFPTIMARTRLAEMGEDVRIVPIDVMPPDQAKLVEQLNRNKDQPVVKSPTKRIDIPGTVSQPITTTVLTGLPPQSPRRKATEAAGAVVEEGDEISKLKQQLKATLAVLYSSNPQKSPLDSGSHTYGEQGEFEPTTLHTLLFIQEGRDITLHGVPPLHMVNRYPELLQPRPESSGRDSVTRNTYLVCRMFWSNESVHSDVCWGTFNPCYNFLQVAPVLVTSALLERMRDNYMIVEVWDKKVSSETDKLVGMVKLSLHQFYLSFRARKIANALLKSEYPVIAVDNYMPVVDPFSGLHFGQLKVVLAMGAESQINNFQRLALSSSGTDPVPGRPTSFLERQDLLKEGGSSHVSGKVVEHQFEIVVEGLRGLKLFENMIWGEADCFVQFFFPAEGDKQEGDNASLKSIPTMKCFRTSTTLCIPDPTFHDTFRRKLILPSGVPVQRELLTACANSGGSITGLPFEVWCRYYHPNVRDQLIAKCMLPLAKLCAMVTMHKSNEACVQSFSLRLSQIEVDGHKDAAEVSAKSKDAGILDVTVSYKCQAAVMESGLQSVSREHAGSHVFLSVGIIRAAGLKAAADSIALLDSSMVYPADVGVNAYVRLNISFLGKANERVTKTVARSFSPEFAHWMDFPCPLLMSEVSSSDATSLAERLESAEAVFEVWHQTPSGLHKDFYVKNNKTGPALHKLAHQTGDVLLGTVVLPLVSLLTRRTGLNGWFAIILPTLGWTKPDNNSDHNNTALDQVVGGLELSIRFAHQDDRDRVISAARSVGWSPIDVDVEQPDWQDADNHHKAHSITVSVDQVSVPPASALITGQADPDSHTRCYIRYKFYDKGAVVSKSKKLHSSDGSLLCSLGHQYSFMLSHTAPLQWYLREERLEIQVWVTFGRGRESEKRPRPRDKLVGSCYIDLESLTDMRRRQQRLSGLFPLFKPGSNSLKAAFVKAQIVSKVSSSANEQTSAAEAAESDMSVSASETEQSSDIFLSHDSNRMINKLPRKQKTDDSNPETSFGVVLAVERAMHLPMVSERNRSGEVSPTTYVSFQSVERSKPTCSCIFPNSCNPVWDYTIETRLSTEYLYKENKNLVLKVWHKPSDAPKTPDKSSDRVLGFVSVDLSSLTKGLQQICGWYNIMDFNGQCRGQIKVSITPLDTHGVLATGSAASSFMLPTFTSRTKTSENTQAVASNIALQLAQLQQQVLQRMGALTSQNEASNVANGPPMVSIFQDGAAKDKETQPASSVTSFQWQPQFVLETRMDDPSKSYLFSSLRRQLQELDAITQRLKNRLAVPMEKDEGSQNVMDNSRSGDILTGTQSDLSTIHTASGLMNTRESSEPSPYALSFEVGTSQESARSRTINISLGLENDADSVRLQEDTSGSHGHKLIDSGVFSARNYSEKSEVASAGPSTEKDLKAVTIKDNLSALPSDSTLPPGVAPAGTLEARFLASDVTNLQTLHSTVQYSGSSGFVPHTQGSNVTESLINESGPDKELGPVTGSSVKIMSKTGTEGKDDRSHSGSVSARTSERTGEEKGEEDYNSDDEEEDEVTPRSGRYGSYHRYREILDAEEIEIDNEEEENVAEEGEVIEVFPRSLNNMSTVLALGTQIDRNLDQVTGENPMREAAAEIMGVPNDKHELDDLAFSPASPNVNALEGTSIWCSEDNDDSFFQQVFEKNRYLMVKTGENVDEVTLDRWLLEQSNVASKARLENWLEVHILDNRERLVNNGAYIEEFVEAEVGSSANKANIVKHRNKAVVNKDANVKGDGSEEVASRNETTPGACDEDIRLHLKSDSEQESEGSLVESTNNIWNQDTGNSSDEEVSRKERPKEQTMNDYLVDQERYTTSKWKDNFQQVAEVEEESELLDKDSERPACGSKSLLSNVELMDSVTLLPLSEQPAQSNKSMATSQAGHKLLPSQYMSSLANEGILPSEFSSDPVLSSDQAAVSEYPPTLELAEVSSHNLFVAQGARPKIQTLLSKVDLQSNSSSRPQSEISSESKTLSQKSLSSGESKASVQMKTNSVTSGENSDKASRKSKRNSTSENSDENMIKSADNSNSSTCKQLTTNNQELDHGASMSKDINNPDKLNQGSTKAASRAKGGCHDYTNDSAYVEGDNSHIPNTHPNNLTVVNSMHKSTDDSGVGHSEFNGDLLTEGSSSSLPNFFMSEKEMQASIKALQMATAAADMNKENLRSQNKVKAVSELVSKMTSTKVKAPALCIKNKQPPSAQEAKRIAKIFSTKMS